MDEQRKKKVKKDYTWKKDRKGRDYDPIPPESISQHRVSPNTDNGIEEETWQKGKNDERIELEKDIETVYNRPRRRFKKRDSEEKSGRRSKKETGKIQLPVEDALTSASILRSPPSPPRSPPSPPRSPPSPVRRKSSPSIEALHVALNPRVSTQSQLSAGIVEEVAAQVMEMLGPEVIGTNDLMEGDLEEVISEPPLLTHPEMEENFDGEIILEPPHAIIEDIGMDPEADKVESIFRSGQPPSETKTHVPIEVVQGTVSEPSLGHASRYLQATSTGVGYSRFRRPGEGFLDMEFEEDTNTQKLHSQIVVKANMIKKLVKEKRLGLPQAYSDHIIDMTDHIIARHTDENADVIFYRKKFKKKEKPKPTEKLAQRIISIADRSEEVLKILESTRSENEGSKDAEQHLAKMVKELHCRHRMLKRLAEEIIAKRWKLQNLALEKEGKLPNVDGNFPTSRDAAKIRRKQRKREWKEKCEGRPKKTKKRTVNEKDMKLIYSNPMAKLKTIAKSYGGPETWREDDPLSKVLNKVGVEIVEKCLKSENEGAKDEEALHDKKVIRLPEPLVPVTIRRRTGLFPSPLQPDLTAKFSKSAMTIFVSNYSKMVVAPSKMYVSDPSTTFDRGHSFKMLNIDKTVLTNNFVDIWKRRSYAIGVLLIIATALLHCVYLCGPRMGDNYVTYSMVQALSGWPLYFPTGIYGLIFLGYLFGGMSVIKTAAAIEHNMSVKAYFKKRKIKFFMWYFLVLYFLTVFVVRCALWYQKIGTTDKEMRAIFKRKFFYNQLPSRMLYSQFLFSCCGANGPGDYSDGKTIGWPKSCYVRVNNYEEYYDEPHPIEYGCSAIVYVYSVMGLACICSLCLVILILATIHPIYLYVYELFICMRSKEPEPWLEYLKD